jgi:hypothetical protein
MAMNCPKIAVSAPFLSECVLRSFLFGPLLPTRPLRELALLLSDMMPMFKVGLISDTSTKG